MTTRLQHKKPLLFIGICLLCFVNSFAQQPDDEVQAVQPPPAVVEEQFVPPKDNFETDKEPVVLQDRKVASSSVDKWKSDKDFWYYKLQREKKPEDKEIVEENETGKKTKKNPDERGIQERKQVREQSSEPFEVYEPASKKPWVQTLLWIVIVAIFVTLLGLFLYNNNVRYRGRRHTLQSEKQISTEDIFAINYQREIDVAAASGNYRFAIRLMFLRLLKSLSNKNIIRYKQDKTNFDYLVELHSSAYYNRFFRLTRSYEYTWYGQFPLPADAYVQIKSDFDELEKELN